MSLFDVTDYDRNFYETNLSSFLPDHMIDIHAHSWLDRFRVGGDPGIERAEQWPLRVARDDSLDDLAETYRLLFPGKDCKAVVFGYPERRYDVDASNDYVARGASAHGFYPLLMSRPEWSADEFARRLDAGRFLGAKAYLNFAPEYIPGNELRIFDFAPHHQLGVLDARHAILILHIPRPGRLRDPVNLHELLEIDRRYPNLSTVVAHVGRAYCDSDVGDAFDRLSGTEHLLFDIGANTNSTVFAQAIRAVGAGRILFGSDLPVTRMRMRRICVDGSYVNVVPPGLYGDISGDPHMADAAPGEAERLTFFLYEEIAAFKKAAEECGLGAGDVERVFYTNACRCIALAQRHLSGLE